VVSVIYPLGTTRCLLWVTDPDCDQSNIDVDFFARREKRCGLYRSVEAIKLYETASIVACALRVCRISRTASRALSDARSLLDG
jgi:hypothetical protein